ncbi:COG3904 family protein [Roseovarius aquimarinus]|uniref:Periplasmic protein n=1 Tax=Roseovarius aquimarinus TaxID=1229156 RepID=A0ABW7I2W1_9RHOB
MSAEGRRSWDVRRVLLAVLGLQIGMAVLLAGSDILGALPQLLRPSEAPGFESPVAPGDQTRRYAPRDTPLPERAPGAPERPYRNTGDMPSRLDLAREDALLRLTGTIAPGDAARVAEWLGAQEGLETAALNSPGGSVSDALAIGRSLREAGLATVVEAGDVCFSACPYLLAAGVSRRVEEGAQVGVHQHYFGENTVLPAFLAVEDIQRGQGEVMEFLIDMDVDPRLMRHVLATRPDDIYLLLPEEMQDYRLVTDGGES